LKGANHSKPPGSPAAPRPALSRPVPPRPQVSVTGALGRRTAHQLDPKAQLVASISSAGSGAAGGGGGVGASLDVDVARLRLDEGAVTPEMAGMEDDSEVFAAPVLEAGGQSGGPEGGSESAGGGGGGGQRQAASGPEQALLLGWAAQVKKASSADDLQQWEMAPYVEAVLTQRASQYALQASARLLKARHERTRGRTRERALLALEQLCAALGGGGLPGAGARRPYAFSVGLPLWPLLRKELAEHHIAMGFVGARQGGCLLGGRGAPRGGAEAHAPARGPHSGAERRPARGPQPSRPPHPHPHPHPNQAPPWPSTRSSTCGTS
jgi:hypothetical protein